MKTPLLKRKPDGHPHHPHAVHDLLRRQRLRVLRRQHRDLVPARGQRPRQPLDVDRQPAHVRPVVGQDKEDLHANNSRFCSHPLDQPRDALAHAHLRRPAEFALRLGRRRPRTPADRPAASRANAAGTTSLARPARSAAGRTPPRCSSVFCRPAAQVVDLSPCYVNLLASPSGRRGPGRRRAADRAPACRCRRW